MAQGIGGRSRIKSSRHPPVDPRLGSINHARAFIRARLHRPGFERFSAPVETRRDRF